MISAFRDISAGEALGKADILASGIYEALVTTAAGLSVAIPSLVLYLLFNAKIERLVGELDDLALEFVDAIAEPDATIAA
jgi:biopolymer transport protein ExbB